MLYSILIHVDEDAVAALTPEGDDDHVRDPAGEAVFPEPGGVVLVIPSPSIPAQATPKEQRRRPHAGGTQ